MHVSGRQVVALNSVDNDEPRVDGDHSVSRLNVTHFFVAYAPAIRRGQ